MQQDNGDKFEDQRNTARQPSGLLVSLALFASDDDERVAEPVSAIVRDVSRHGAGLLLKQAISDQHHLFYEPLDHKCRLVLEFEIEQDLLAIPVQPVWFRLDEDEHSGYFRMGIEFRLPTDNGQVKRLEKQAKASLGQGQGWLAGLLEKLV